MVRFGFPSLHSHDDAWIVLAAIKAEANATRLLAGGLGDLAKGAFQF
jgi:hypothetical protein